MASLIGQQFGNYRLLRFLGDGGFAEVYLGQHKELGTEAAIKVLKTSLSVIDVQKFRSEATTIAKLRNPNIVRVFDFDVKGNIPFMVMDYAPNGTLEKRHPSGTPVSLSTIIPYVSQMAEALQYAHNAKIIHRDVKPANMLIGEQDEVLLSDFGIAVIAHSTHSMILQDKIGTLVYMAPEQLDGKPTIFSDQYALGVVVYEWLCGEVPFQGTVLEIMSQHHFAAPPSICAKAPTISPYVEQVVFRALAKDPQQRFPDVKDFANALEQAYNSQQPTILPIPPHPPGTPLSPTLPAVIVPVNPSPPLLVQRITKEDLAVVRKSTKNIYVPYMQHLVEGIPTHFSWSKMDFSTKEEYKSFLIKPGLEVRDFTLQTVFEETGAETNNYPVIGIVFRFDSQTGKGYRFIPGSGARWELQEVHTLSPLTNAPLAMPFVAKLLWWVERIDAYSYSNKIQTIVAQGTTIDFYVDLKHVGRVENITMLHGTLSFFVEKHEYLGLNNSFSRKMLFRLNSWRLSAKDFKLWIP